MDFDREIEKVFQQAFSTAIASDPSMLDQLASCSEEHNERNANMSQGNPYFKVGDRVGLVGDWSLGVIEEIRQTQEGYEYLVTWLDFNDKPISKPNWFPQEYLTL